jgi:hypothetical protein
MHFFFGLRSLPGQPWLHSKFEVSLEYIDPVFEKRQTGLEDGSVVKSTGCSSSFPEFNSQQPSGGSQPSVMKSNALLATVYSYNKINKSLKNKQSGLVRWLSG